MRDWVMLENLVRDAKSFLPALQATTIRPPGIGPFKIQTDKERGTDRLRTWQLGELAR